MLHIFVKQFGPRVEYIFDLIFRENLGLDITFYSDIEKFKTVDGLKLSYTEEQIGAIPFIKPSKILFENGVDHFLVQTKKEGDLVKLFPTKNSEKAVLDFDIFGASFFLVSRYEEYWESKKDKHGRYRASNSIAYKKKFLKRPIVNLYIELLKKELIKIYPSLVFAKHSFQVQPTIDIDNAYAFKHKGLFLNSGSFVKKVLSLKVKDAVTQLKVGLGKVDPYDTYAYQNEIHRKYGVRAIYFFLVGDRNRYDKNLPYDSSGLKNLIEETGLNYEIGCHPSYQSNIERSRVNMEKLRLEGIHGKKITKSRQHYIKLHIPETYRKLIDLGIEDDYSMGYPSRVGFRASICTPFHFYDIEKEEKTALLLHPFCFMDVTLKDYSRLHSKKIIDYLRPILADVKNVQGNFSFIFHNESMGAWKRWRNWGGVYEEVIKMSVKQND